MKVLLSLAVVLSSTSVLAATEASCPANTQLVKSCLSTPQKGDNEFAGNFFKAIAICQSGDQFMMSIIDGEGKADTDKVTRQVRMGGTSYIAENDSVRVSLDFATGMAPGQGSKQARLTTRFKQANMDGSSTYTCK
jgi:hypothetical protein